MTTMRAVALLVACTAIAPRVDAPRAQSAGGDCAGVNVLTAEEKASGWQLLFDGATKAGWHGYLNRSTESWTIEDCALKTVGTAGNYGSDLRPDLVTEALYTNFELRLDWKATKGGNSGVMYAVVEDPKYAAAWMTGPEYQLIDDVGFPQKLEADRTTGADYSMHAPDTAQKVLQPIGAWNTIRLVVHDTHVEHWLNGRKVVEFERWTPEWNALRDFGKWKGAPDYGTAKTGHIALQDHGSVFWFRNLKIRRTD